MSRSTASAALLTGLLLLAGSLRSAAEEIAFRFDPPHGTTFVRNLVVTTVTDLGTAGKETEVTRSKTRLKYEKSPDGTRFTLTATPLSTTIERDGKAVHNPVLDVANGLVLTYRIDPLGNLVSIEGYEVLMDKLRQALPPESVPAAAQLVNAESLAAKERAEWSGKYSEFAGASFAPGSGWEIETPFTLPTGEMVPCTVTTEIVEKVKCGPRDCVRIRFRYAGDTAALLTKMKQAAGAATVHEGGGVEAKLPQDRVTITGTGERVLDPATMLIYSETLERTVKKEPAASKEPAKGKAQSPVIWTEKREATFEY